MSQDRFSPGALVNRQQRPLLLVSDPREAIAVACGEVGIETEAGWHRLCAENDDPLRDRRVFEHLKLQTFVGPGDAVDLLDDLCVFVTNPANAAFLSALERIYGRSRFGLRLPASYLPSLRRAARRVLLRLWSAEVILLPITVPLRSTDDVQKKVTTAAELYTFCASFPEGGASGSAAFRLRSHATAWLPSTAWTRPERITMQGALEVNHLLYDCRKGRMGFVAATPGACVRLLLQKLLETMPERLGFSADDLRQFELHFARRLRQDVPFERISEALAERDAEQKAAKKKRPRGKRTVGRGANAPRSSRIMEKAERLASGQGGTEAIEEMIYGFSRRRDGWWADMSDHSFLDVTLDDEARRIWGSLFDRYLEYRIRRGMEDQKAPEGALRCLADYLGVALPIWCTFEELPVKPPRSPTTFRRGLFVDPKDARLKAASYIAYVERRYASVDTQYAIIHQTWQFFSFVALNYEDDPEIAGPGFNNPLSKDFDLPRVRGARSRGTNKVPFGRSVLPHLVLWLYAVEAWGQYVNDRGIELPNKASVGDPAEFGFVPVYWYMNRAYPISHVPFASIRPQRVRHGTSLTGLRLIISAVETGIRFQSMQWLCKRKFDKGNAGRPVRDVANLHVNTDKCGGPFDTVILRRVRDLLLREQAEQDASGFEDREICYAEREHSRFAPLVPLFRDLRSGEPVSDALYDRAWTWVLSCFQTHMRTIEPVVLLLPRPIKARPLARASHGGEYCPLRYQRLHTPHSARSTFITRRSSFISLADLAELVGHANAGVTAHYDHPETDALGAKLLHADAAMRNAMPEPAPIREGPAFIKAADVNSSLVKALSGDREGAIKRFGMVAIRPILESEEEAKSGLDLLRVSPMSHIVFRETHVCPVGENCPAEVIAVTQATFRCGSCPLACKSVDHLPAIVAKQRLLQERIQSAQETYQRLTARGDAMGELGEIYDAIDADIQEYLGWRLAEEVLEDMRATLGAHTDMFHTEEPEMIRRHLTRVVKPSSEQEFILRRVMEANAYPTMATDRLRLLAARLRKRILAGLEVVEVPQEEQEEEDEIAALASLVKLVLKAKGATLEELASTMRKLPSPRSGRLLLGNRASETD